MERLGVWLLLASICLRQVHFEYIKPNDLVTSVTSQVAQATELQSSRAANEQRRIHVVRIIRSDFAIPRSPAPSNILTHIVGGTNATRGEVPWQAFIVANRSLTCGGSLISTRVVLTAGHCAYKCTTFDVYLGGLLRTLIEVNEQVFRTTRARVHEGYNPSNLANDVAIIVLEKPAVLNQFVGLVRLPKSGDSILYKNYLRKQSKACGFGMIRLGGPFGSSLSCVTLTVWSNNDCALYFKEGLVRDYTLCTMPGSKAICKGDSGGSLVFYESDNQPTIIAIVSFVAALGCSNYPNGFVRVENYLDWIQRNSGIRPRL